jgi:hypothetical protein
MKPALHKNACFGRYKREKYPVLPEFLFEIRRTPLGPLAFFAFGDIFELAALEKGLHSDFPATGGTKEFLGGAGRTGIFT